MFRTFWIALSTVSCFWFLIISVVANLISLDMVTKNAILLINIMSAAIVTFL